MPLEILPPNLISIPQCAALVNSLYDGGAPTEFDIYDESDHGVCWGAKLSSSGVWDVVFRGSKNTEDWIRDFLAIVCPISHARFGPIHPGFDIGMAEVMADIMARTKGPRTFQGHSLGAGRTPIATAIAIDTYGQPPLRQVLFAPPKAGFAQLWKFIAGVETLAFQNTYQDGVDPVTTLPLRLPPEFYVQVPLTKITGGPPPQDVLERFGDFWLHHMPLYVAGVHGM